MSIRGREADRVGEQRARPSDRVERAVWVKAGGRCTICNAYLLEDEQTGRPVPSGEVAHIVGATSGPKSPRGQADIPVKERNVESNLMLVCHAQHRVIDDGVEQWDFDVATLRRLKRQHEDRVRALTDIKLQEHSLVLRLVGKVRGDAVDIPNSAIATTLLVSGRFPRYALRGFGQEYEVDLRDLPDEGSHAYWQRSAAAIGEQLEPLHAERRTLADADEIAVFAFGRIPLLIALGTHLDDTVTCRLYQRHRSNGGWAWPGSEQTVTFEHVQLSQGMDPAKVAVLFSVTASVQPARAVHLNDEYSVYELRPKDLPAAPELLRSAADLEQFRLAWQSLLAELERLHPQAVVIDIVPAVPPAAAVEIGRTPMAQVHPALRVFERDDSGRYCEAVTL